MVELPNMPYEHSRFCSAGPIPEIVRYAEDMR